MDQLEVDLLSSRNLALLDRFDQNHARHVLTLWGRAYGCLPENRHDQSRQQDAFLHQAVEG